MAGKNSGMVQKLKKKFKFNSWNKSLPDLFRKCLWANRRNVQKMENTGTVDQEKLNLNKKWGSCVYLLKGVHITSVTTSAWIPMVRPLSTP